MTAALYAAAGGLVGAALLFSGGQAQATVLIILADPPSQTGTAYEVAFKATESTTTIEFSGYQKYAYEYVSEIRVSRGGGANLLGGAWTFTPAARGSDARTVFDGTSVPGLWFGGFVPGYYDTFSQTLATAAGAEYDVAFTFSNISLSGHVAFSTPGLLDAPILPSSALLVTTPTGQVGSVPEPSTWAMAVTGFLILGVAGYRGRRLARPGGRLPP